jgi:hypothetical protein
MLHGGRSIRVEIPAARLMVGAISVSNPSHLLPNWPSKLIKPVILPSGLGRLAIKPLPTGSDTITNTIGIVFVSLWSAAVTAVPCERITSGRDATNSFANICIRSTSPDVQRTSICKAESAVQPSL